MSARKIPVGHRRSQLSALPGALTHRIHRDARSEGVPVRQGLPAGQRWRIDVLCAVSNGPAGEV